LCCDIHNILSGETDIGSSYNVELVDEGLVEAFVVEEGLLLEESTFEMVVEIVVEDIVDIVVVVVVEDTHEESS